MLVHNWKPIDAGIFHAIHHGWITEIARALNRGLLPDGFYALPERYEGLGDLTPFATEGLRSEPDQ